MANSETFSLLPLLSIAVILALYTPMAAALLRVDCANFGTFTSNSRYQNNLNALLGSLSANTPRNGFSSGAVGRYADRVYGLALCRGDVSTADCKCCVADATTKILDDCRDNNRGIIWYNYCLVKYSEYDFLGEIDTVNKFYMADMVDAKDQQSFTKNTRELLSRLAAKAARLKSSYAAGVKDISGSVKLYGLTQCTRDLSGEDCKKCLDDAIAELPKCCGATVGGRVVGGSCNFRYEIYPFYF